MCTRYRVYFPSTVPGTGTSVQQVNVPVREMSSTSTCKNCSSKKDRAQITKQEQQQTDTRSNATRMNKINNNNINLF